MAPFKLYKMKEIMIDILTSESYIFELSNRQWSMSQLLNTPTNPFTHQVQP